MECYWEQWPVESFTVKLVLGMYKKYEHMVRTSRRESGKDVVIDVKEIESFWVRKSNLPSAAGMLNRKR